MIELSGKQWLLIAGACALVFALIGFTVAAPPRPPQPEKVSHPTLTTGAGETTAQADAAVVEPKVLEPKVLEPKELGGLPAFTEEELAAEFAALAREEAVADAAGRLAAA